MDYINRIARLITDDPDIFNEGWSVTDGSLDYDSEDKYGQISAIPKVFGHNINIMHNDVKVSMRNVSPYGSEGADTSKAGPLRELKHNLEKSNVQNWIREGATEIANYLMSKGFLPTHILTPQSTNDMAQNYANYLAQALGGNVIVQEVNQNPRSEWRIKITGIENYCRTAAKSPKNPFHNLAKKDFEACKEQVYAKWRAAIEKGGKFSGLRRNIKWNVQNIFNAEEIIEAGVEEDSTILLVDDFTSTNTTLRCMAEAALELGVEGSNIWSTTLISSGKGHVAYTPEEQEERDKKAREQEERDKYQQQRQKLAAFFRNTQNQATYIDEKTAKILGIKSREYLIEYSNLKPETVVFFRPYNEYNMPLPLNQSIKIRLSDFYEAMTGDNMPDVSI